MQFARWGRPRRAFCTLNRGLAESGTLDLVRHFPFLAQPKVRGKLLWIGQLRVFQRRLQRTRFIGPHRGAALVHLTLKDTAQIAASWWGPRYRGKTATPAGRVPGHVGLTIRILSSGIDPAWRLAFSHRAWMVLLACMLFGVGAARVGLCAAVHADGVLGPAQELKVERRMRRH